MINDNQLSNEYMVNEELIGGIDKNEKPILLNYNRNDNQSGVEKIIKYKSPDLTILGLGSDGHTASLFPGNTEILNENDNIFLNVNNEWEDYNRVSLSFAYIMKSDQIIFFASGERKAKALKECLAGDYDPIQFPAQFIIKNYNNDIYILCDKAAGKYIE